MCFVQKKYDDVVATALIATDKTFVLCMVAVQDPLENADLCSTAFSSAFWPCIPCCKMGSPAHCLIFLESHHQRFLTSWKTMLCLCATTITIVYFLDGRTAEAEKSPIVHFDPAAMMATLIYFRFSF